MKNHKPKLLSALLALSMLFSYATQIFAAQTDVISISSPDGLISLAYDSDGLAKNYRLECDIDMSAATDSRPMKTIGSKTDKFEGVFDGNGHTIKNLSLTGEALFGYISEKGVLQNLTLENASIDFSKNDSSKYPAAFVSSNYGEITNCFSVSSTVTSEYSAPVGGFVGSNFGTISKCGVSGGSVTFTGTSTTVGGFVGNMRDGTISECFASAEVSGKKWVGGFVGKAEDGAIEDCYAVGDVSGSEENGGFAGAFLSPAEIKNSYAANNVKATTGGGFAGGKGFSFATAGEPENPAYCSDFALPESSGAFENDSAWAKTASEMKTEKFAKALSDKWAYDKDINGGYPYLSNAVPPVSKNSKTTATLMIAGYDRDNYVFYKLSDEIEVSSSKETVTVTDILDAAVENGDITYAMGTDGMSGMIVTINNVTAASTDGWMFEINGEMSWVGAQSAIVSDGDEILWYLGTPENGYSAPVWDEIGITSEVTEISTPEQLIAVASAESLSGNYKLTADLDMSGIEFAPIGSEEAPFCGIFNGNGFKISNLTINKDAESRNVGLFGVTSGAKIKNVTLENASITGGSVVGALVGRATSEENSITLISNCKVSGNVTALGNSYVKQTDAGGLVGVCDSFENQLSGNVYSSAIDKCEADVKVGGKAQNAEDSGHIGGLVGLNKGTISNSSAKGEVTGGNTVGGFVGSNLGGSIYESNAAGNTSGYYSVGGFAGFSGTGSVIESCYSTGNVAALGENGSNFGGFAGYLSGNAKNCISSGTLSPGANYNGGFAGYFDGTLWSYNDDLRSVSGCYGNIVSSSGEAIKPIGSYIGGIHAPTDNAAEEIGVNGGEAEEKIQSMLSLLNEKSKLAAEAEKYKTKSAVPATVKVDSDITALVARLNSNASADGEIEVSYKSENNSIKATKSGYTLIARADEDKKETITLTFGSKNAEYDRPVTVTLYSTEKNTDKDALLENIFRQYSKTASDYWQTAVLCAYENAFGGSVSENVKSKFVSSAVASLQSSDKDTTLAMNIIALRGLGFNPAKITLKDGTTFDAVEKLTESKSTGNNGDAYKLLAYHNCGYTGDDEKIVKERLLRAQLSDEGWSNDNDDGVDADTTGAVILGLASHYNTDSDVKSALDNAVRYLSSLMQADGNIKSSYKESNYGTNANTSSICAMGLSALGIDISSDERFAVNGVSLYDGIMNFASDDETGFMYDYDGKNTNELATKQAALAILSAESSTSVLDFSKNASSAINLKETSGTSGGIGGGSSSSSGAQTAKTITVYFTLTGDDIHEEGGHPSSPVWIENAKIEISENSTAKDVIEKALKDNGYTANGVENGYITEITTPDGLTLGEYSNGEQSGWLYSVNGEAPAVGISDFKMKNGDKLNLYYADLWEALSPDDAATFPDVAASDWFFEAAKFASENKLIAGNENGEFMPNEALTRAMAVTILGRFDENGGSYEYANDFADVTASDWFAAYVAWGVNAGVAFGMGAGLFAPNENVTREQLAAMICRYAEAEGILGEGEADLSVYADEEDVSDWAYEAMQRCVANGLINGTDDKKLDSKGTATRAQFAVIMMNLNNLKK